MIKIKTIYIRSGFIDLTAYQFFMGYVMPKFSSFLNVCLESKLFIFGLALLI